MTEPMPPSNGAVLRTPQEWQRITGVRVLDPDGWRDSSVFGPKDWDARISRAEFEQRAAVSTVEQAV